MRRVVLDTNVLVAALRSDLGASFKLLSLVGVTDRFQICLSVPLVLEYEDVLSRKGVVPNMSRADIKDLIDYLCSVARSHRIFFLWRPLLRDPEDEMVLEIAVSGSCDTIVTFNQRDFAGAERFGIQVLRPDEFLRQIGELE
jgi:putative PIN family toxin of toxin-antitoxin system